MKKKSSLLFSLLVLFGTQALAAASPRLDLSFGLDGIVVTHFSNSSSWANAAAIQEDGKIVLAGQTCRYRMKGFTSLCYFALARYNRGGSLDQNFGIRGKVKLGVPDVNA